MEGNRLRHEVRINCLRARRVSIRIEAATLILFDPDSRELLRTGPNPLTYDQASRLCGARPGWPTTPAVGGRWAGQEWTDNGKACDRRALKRRASNTAQIVPIPNERGGPFNEANARRA